jgi:hypothetical protein
MYTEIDITIRDNDDEKFVLIHSMRILSTEWTILNDTYSEDYDEIWDRLCDKVDRIVPCRPNWYIDKVSKHK